MNYRDFHEQFYQNPSFAYSHYQPFFGGHGPIGYIEKIRSSRESRFRSRGSKGTEGEEKCQGKYLKHIFNALKNKTSSELATFINLNSVVNEIEYELSSISFLNQSPRNVYPCDTYETYTANTTNKKVGLSEDDVTTNHSRTDHTIGSDITDSSLRSLIESQKKVVYDTDLGAEKKNYHQKAEGDTSNKDEHCVCPEEGGEKPNERQCFLTKVFSLFKNKKDNKTCDCCVGQNETQQPTDSPDWLEPIFKNSKCRCSQTTNSRNVNCKCSETIIKLDTSIFHTKKSSKPKCNTLGGYKCDRCGKIDLNKLDHRCPKLKLDEDALMFLLKLEAKQNFKLIKTIQKQLREQHEKLEELTKKYISLIKMIAPEKYVSTDTITTKEKGTKTELTDPDSCVCATKKKPSCFARMFKKSKCDTSCKCSCIVQKPDEKLCKYYIKKKSSKTKKKEKDKSKKSDNEASNSEDGKKKKKDKKDQKDKKDKNTTG